MFRELGGVGLCDPSGLFKLSLRSKQCLGGFLLCSGFICCRLVSNHFNLRSLIQLSSFP